MPVLVTTPSKLQTLVIGPTDYREKNVNSNVTRDNATGYVSGYLLQKCLKKHNCQNFRAAVVSRNLDNERKLLCYFKAYESECAVFGGLHAPTIPFLEYIIHLEDTFVANFSIYTKTFCVGKNILNKLRNVPVPFQTCPDFPIDFLQKLFLRMRIYYCLKFENRDFSCCKRKDRKYIKVTHL